MDELSVGQLVSIRHIGGQGVWNRALVEDVNSNCADLALFMVDDGKRLLMSDLRSNIRTSGLPEIAWATPAQAFWCRLSDDSSASASHYQHSVSLNENFRFRVDDIKKGKVGRLGNEPELTVYVTIISNEPSIASVYRAISASNKKLALEGASNTSARTRLSEDVLKEKAKKEPTAFEARRASPTAPLENMAKEKKKNQPADKELLRVISPVPSNPQQQQSRSQLVARSNVSKKSSPPPEKPYTLVVPLPASYGQENRNRSGPAILSHIVSPGHFYLRLVGTDSESQQPGVPVGNKFEHLSSWMAAQYHTSSSFQHDP